MQETKRDGSDDVAEVEVASIAAKWTIAGSAALRAGLTLDELKSRWASVHLEDEVMRMVCLMLRLGVPERWLNHEW